MQIPQNQPKFKIGDRVIPTNVFDRDEYPEGYVIGLIALDQHGLDDFWIYWGQHEYLHINGYIITPGFGEPYLELYLGEEIELVC